MTEDIGDDPFVQPGAVHRGADQGCAYPELPDLEYIIDGGPTDDTVEVIKKREEHLAYWVSEPDEGQTDALIKGFNWASGDIFCWLCSDDHFE
jgi:Glycosyl transferase family 2